MLAVCLDLEGVLIPEVWVNVAKSTGIDSLLKTTRDEPDYDRLMSYRLRILEENSITILELTDQYDILTKQLNNYISKLQKHTRYDSTDNNNLLSND